MANIDVIVKADRLEKLRAGTTCINKLSLINRVKKRSIMFQLVIQRIQIYMIFILMHQRLNMFKMKIILVFSVIWILLCLLQMNMLKNMFFVTTFIIFIM